jgi:hypothetical protein
MLDACIRTAVGRSYVFSNLCKFIMKAQIAYLTSKPSHPLANVSPCWWVTWLEFAHKPKTHIITLAMLALIATEVFRPRLPGPVLFITSYFKVTKQRMALDCEKNYFLKNLSGFFPVIKLSNRAKHSELPSLVRA